MSQKILYVIGSLNTGGAERHLIQVLPGIKRRGYDVAVFTLKEKGDLSEILEEDDISIIAPSFPNVFFMFPTVVKKVLMLTWASSLFVRTLVNIKPDIIHFFLPESYLIGGLLSLPFRRSLRIMSRRSQNRYQRRYPFLARLERWLHRRMDAILGNAGLVCSELLAEGAPADRVGLIHNGIDIGPFEIAKQNSGFLRSSLGIGKDALVISIVANLISYKGHIDLLQAMAHISSNLQQPWYILCIGKG